MLFLIIPISAYDIKVDDIFYNVDITAMTAEVTHGNLSYERYSGNIVIPSSVVYNNRELTVTSIGESAFEECKNLESAYIPNSVLYLGNRAFYNCEKLTSIHLPADITVIPEEVFSGCKKLTDIAIPDNVVEIGKDSFHGCSSIKKLRIPSSVKTLGSRCFFWTSDLASLTFEDCEEPILFLFQRVYVGGDIYTKGRDYGTFTISPCDEIYFGRSIMLERDNDYPILTDYSFTSRHIKQISIGKYTDYLDPELIDPTDLKQLQSIYCYGNNPPTIWEFTNSQYMDCEVFVPVGSLEAYKANSIWGKFWNIQERDYEKDPVEDTAVETIYSVKSLSENGRYDIQGNKVDSTYKGLVIVRCSDGSTKKIVQR